MSANRYDWLRAVMQSEVSATAKIVATALAVQFANDETGQVNPSRETLASYLKVHRDTVKRAVRELKNAGWLAMIEGRGRGHSTGYVFLSPGKIVAFAAPQKGAEAPSEKGANLPARGEEKGANLPGKGCKSAPPHYKERTGLEQEGRERASSTPPQPRFTIWTVHAHKPDQVRAWNEWLATNAFPSLTTLDYRTSDAEGTGWAMPFRWPPSEDRWQDVATTKRFVRWQMSRKGIEEDARRRASA